jgi:hypothetical protein
LCAFATQKCMLVRVRSGCTRLHLCDTNYSWGTLFPKYSVSSHPDFISCKWEQSSVDYLWISVHDPRILNAMLLNLNNGSLALNGNFKLKRKLQDQLQDNMETDGATCIWVVKTNYKGNVKIKAVISNSALRVFVILVRLMVRVHYITKLPETVPCFPQDCSCIYIQSLQTA